MKVIGKKEMIVIEKRRTGIEKIVIVSTRIEIIIMMIGTISKVGEEIRKGTETIIVMMMMMIMIIAVVDIKRKLVENEDHDGTAQNSKTVRMIMMIIGKKVIAHINETIVPSHGKRRTEIVEGRELPLMTNRGIISHRKDQTLNLLQAGLQHQKLSHWPNGRNFNGKKTELSWRSSMTLGDDQEPEPPYGPSLGTWQPTTKLDRCLHE